MNQPTNKVPILLIGLCKDHDLIKSIIDKLRNEYSNLIEFVSEGKEKLQIDISGMNAIETNIDEEVEFIIKTAIKVKKYERVRNRAIKKASYEAKKKFGIINNKNIN